MFNNFLKALHHSPRQNVHVKMNAKGMSDIATLSVANMEFANPTMVNARDALARIHVNVKNVQRIANVQLIFHRMIMAKQFSLPFAVNIRNLEDARLLTMMMTINARLSAMMMLIVVVTISVALLDVLDSAQHPKMNVFDQLLHQLDHLIKKKEQQAYKTYQTKICDRQQRKEVLRHFVASLLVSHHPQSHGREADLK
jgi:hypothetical protein